MSGSKELTERMIADWLPFVSDEEDFIASVYEDVADFGDITRIEPHYGKSGRLLEMRYYQEEFDEAMWVLPVYVLTESFE